MKGIVLCIKDFLKKIFSSCCFLLGLLACSVLSVGFSSNVSAVDASIPVKAFAGEVLYKNGCKMWTDNDVEHSSNGTQVCDFHGTNLGWKRLDLQDVNVTDGWYYQFYLNYYVDTVAGASPTIIVQPLQSLNESFSVVAFNQVASSEYVGSIINPNSNYGYSYTYSVIVRANETTEHSIIRLGGLGGVGNFIGHLDSGSGNTYPQLHISVSSMHAFQKLDYTAQLDDIISAIEDLSSSSGSSAIVNAVNDPQWVHDQQQDTQDAYDDFQSQLDGDVNQQAIESKVSSILSVIESFVVAISHPVVSTCILPIDLRNYVGAGFYEVDLCHLSPPAGITNVLNVIFIFFVLGLAYSAIRSVVQMYKEVIDG